ncbi:MAG: bifunctional oligoribonuclease/PAP phosphatase NrnA [Oscillospiraceae bacterium]
MNKWKGLRMNHRQVYDLIKKSQKILIATHVNPDFDALCSELLMAEYLKLQKKTFTIVHEKPLASMYHVLRGHQQIKILPKSLVDYDLAIILDCGDMGRIGEVQKVFPKGKSILNIDHHVTNVQFGRVNLVDPSASSTAEVIFEMFKAWKVKLTKKMAEYFYVGILTDTGSFRYQNTTARTHQIVSELLKFGISPALFYRMAYEDLDAEGFKLLLKAVNQAEYFNKGEIVCLKLSRKSLDQAAEQFDLKDKIFYLFRMMKKVEVIVLFSEMTSRKTRVNFRSTGSANVAAVAKLFGGGGHKAASGCILDRDIKKAKQVILKEVLKKVA